MYAAIEDKAKLEELIGREIVIRIVDCDCDFWPYCYRCAGTGQYRQLYFADCQHPVLDGQQTECEQDECVDDEPWPIPCCLCGQPTTRDTTYGDLCAKCCRAENE